MEPMTEIFALRFSERLAPDRFEWLLQYVSTEKQERVRRFLRWQDAHRGLYADLLIRDIVKKRLAMKNEDIAFSFNAYGKPSLDHQTDFHFNLSHSGDWIACAVDRFPIGIDVEKIAPIDLDIARNFFFHQEYDDLMSRADAEKLSYFFTLWTLKESYIKAEGMGLSLPLDSFSISALDRENIALKVKEQPEGRRFFKMYDIDRDYKLAVCTWHSQLPDRVVIKEVDELIEEYD
jgi:4'-phosphopantetheinyl transferase